MSDKKDILTTLKKLSKVAIELGDVDIPDTDALWISYAPATDDQIAALEQRLGVSLPADYRDFLAVTDGMEAPSSTEPYWSSTELVDYLRDYDPELIQIWRETGNEEIADQLERSILVAGRDDEQQFLLIPPTDGYDQWQYWKFAHWIPGEEPYDGLVEYFEYCSTVITEMIAEENEEKIKRLTDSERQEIEELKKKIDRIMETHGAAYEALESESFDLYLQQQRLKQKYGALDKRTGLNALLERLGELYESAEEE